MPPEAIAMLVPDMTPDRRTDHRSSKYAPVRGEQISPPADQSRPIKYVPAGWVSMPPAASEHAATDRAGLAARTGRHAEAHVVSRADANGSAVVNADGRLPRLARVDDRAVVTARR
jgi:hypothetical protein